MIVWTEKGPYGFTPEDEATIQLINEKAKSFLDEHPENRITIKELIEHEFGEDAFFTTKFEGEYFVYIDEYGWDKKGYRKLYETVMMRKEL